MSDRQIVCILGMHRSGTSVVARLLNLLGVDLGPADHMMSPHLEDNPKGYWEHLPLLAINEELLTRSGGNWHDPPTFNPGWEASPALEDLRERARAVVDEDFGTQPLWGWKDPRTCLTLPFWQALLDPMTYVLCFRNPADVQRSLARRDEVHAAGGSPLGAKGSELWVEYSARALEHTSGAARLVVFYEDLLGAEWRAELRRLAAYIGRPDRAEDAAVVQSARTFIEADLRHHRTSLVELTADRNVDFPGKAVYFALRAHASRESEALPDPDLSRALDLLGAAAAENQEELGVLRSRHEQLAATTSDRDRLAKEGARLEEQIAEIAADRDRLMQTLFREAAQLGEQIGQGTAERDRLLEAVARLGEEILRITADRERLAEEVARLGEQVSQLVADRDQQTREDATLRELIGRLTAERDASVQDGERVRMTLADRERGLAALHASRGWKLLTMAHRLKTRVLMRG